MFEKIRWAAEKMANSVSRRNFFGRLGRGAAVLAAGLGGVLLTATDAVAGSGGKCCLGGGGGGTGLPSCKHGPCGNGPGTTVRCSDWLTLCPQK